MNFAPLTGTLRSRWLLACACMALLLGCQEQSRQSREADDGASAGVSGGSAGTSVAGSSSGSGGGPAGADTGGAMPSANGGAGSESSGAGGKLARGGSSSAGGAAGGNAGMESVAGSTSSSLATIRSAATWLDDQGNVVNAHGGGVIQVGDTFYLHGMYITYSANASSDANKAFKGFSMYSSRDLSTWKSEGLVLPPQASGELGPNRIGERPHIIRCASSGEFVLYAHAASLDYQTDKEVVYATSPTVNGKYTYRGALQNAAGVRAEHSDMSAFVDSENVPYVLTEGGHVYKLSSDCHSWLSDTSFSAIGGTESPTLFKAGASYFWLMSEKTGWRANDNSYATAANVAGPWTKQGLVAPTGEKTWLSQSTWVLPISGAKGTTYVFWGDRWDGTESTDHPGRNNTLATYVVQPIVVNGGKISMPTYYSTWKLDVSAGTWSP